MKTTEQQQVGPGRREMAALCQSFPSLRGKSGTTPWDAVIFARVFSGGQSEAEKQAAAFVLNVWNASDIWSKKPYAVGAFNFRGHISCGTPTIGRRSARGVTIRFGPERGLAMALKKVDRPEPAEAVQLSTLVERNFIPDCCGGCSARYAWSVAAVRLWDADLGRGATTSDFTAEAVAKFCSHLRHADFGVDRTREYRTRLLTLWRYAHRRGLAPRCLAVRVDECLAPLQLPSSAGTAKPSGEFDPVTSPRPRAPSATITRPPIRRRSSPTKRLKVSKAIRPRCVRCGGITAGTCC